MFNRASVAACGCLCQLLRFLWLSSEFWSHLFCLLPLQSEPHRTRVRIASAVVHSLAVSPPSHRSPGGIPPGVETAKRTAAISPVTGSSCKIALLFICKSLDYLCNKILKIEKIMKTGRSSKQFGPSARLSLCHPHTDTFLNMLP